MREEDVALIKLRAKFCTKFCATCDIFSSQDFHFFISVRLLMSTTFSRMTLFLV